MDDRDHDLLLRVDTKLDNLIESFAKVEIAVAAKADTERVSKLEERVTSLQAKVFTAGGAVSALQFALQFYLHSRH